ncbi:unnamed protein product [Effrenium voratum]|nr:unnamed protein product [Effrenium voratum]
MWTGWDWTWWSAPSGPYLPRERVTAEPVVGEVVEWKDSFGWAKADAPIDHHCFKQRGGRIYVHKKDVTSGAITTGCRVRFHVYKDTQGLGAAEVQEPSVIMENAKLPTCGFGLLGPLLSLSDGAVQGQILEANKKKVCGTSNIDNWVATSRTRATPRS